MALSYIWGGFLIAAFVFALIKVMNSADEVAAFTEITEAIFDGAIVSMEIIIPLIGIMTFWLGMMKVGEKAGLIRFIAKLIGPFFSKIFKGVPKDHPANGAMVMNFSANMLGMDNAATPLGLKAMDELQTLNPDKERASDAQIMFLVMNTSGLTLIPTVIMADRSIGGAANPTDIFLPILLATFFSSLIGFTGVAIAQRINVFNRTVLTYVGGAIALVGCLIWYLSTLNDQEIQRFSTLFSGLIIYGLVVAFLVAGLIKKLNIFEVFIEGAKEGFQMGIRIVPYLVGLLVAIAAFKASGGMGYITDGIRWGVTLFTAETSFVDALPTGLMKPISGSGAKAMMYEVWECKDGVKNCVNVDSFSGKLSSIMRGATETTFYVLAVYFGSVGIRNTRNAVWLGLLADLAGIIAAIVMAYIFF